MENPWWRTDFILLDKSQRQTPFLLGSTALFRPLDLLEGSIGITPLFHKHLNAVITRGFNTGSQGFHVLRLKHAPHIFNRDEVCSSVSCAIAIFTQLRFSHVFGHRVLALFGQTRRHKTFYEPVSCLFRKRSCECSRYNCGQKQDRDKAANGVHEVIPLKHC